MRSATLGATLTLTRHIAAVLLHVTETTQFANVVFVCDSCTSDWLILYKHISVTNGTVSCNVCCRASRSDNKMSFMEYNRFILWVKEISTRSPSCKFLTFDVIYIYINRDHGRRGWGQVRLPVHRPCGQHLISGSGDCESFYLQGYNAMQSE
jgi:hypothetical protein